jgi:hypothetical protein
MEKVQPAVTFFDFTYFSQGNSDVNIISGKGEKLLRKGFLPASWSSRIGFDLL